ncbi:YidC/Oxa1 family membrane protein insertase [Allonocardiopsis opalescens]|uniref:Membrane protein insertase YidC n=1 Tax=Allonocardiopsis opalescens TaxID=1144618 RepID=A0A2T0Q710_9ACTN|nr:membrane protein insertase YidC [Allonocardiopsis opalescens]PRX99571.1 YidC/Oxa1 family membrane protein insertase [Allonocardiopsis opalescens]
MFNWLFALVSWPLAQIHAGLSLFLDPNGGWAWGLSILLLTLCVRILALPLTLKSMQSMRKMQELQPKVLKLREKYKDDKQRLNQETMQLYQAEGANPVGGCLPLLIQTPVFIALFQVLWQIADNPENAATLAGFSTELVASARDAFIITAPVIARFVDSNDVLIGMGADPVLARVMIGTGLAISAVTTFLTVRQGVMRSMKQTPDNPMIQAQKIMMYMSPAFALFGLTLPIGVLIYWVTTNSWTLLQNHFVYKRYPVKSPDELAEEERERARAAREAGKAAAARAKALRERRKANGAPGAAPNGASADKPADEPAPSGGATPNGSTGGVNGRKNKKQKKSAESEPAAPPMIVRNQQRTNVPRSKRKRSGS